MMNGRGAKQARKGEKRNEVRERTCLTLAEEERGGNNFCWEKMDGKDGRRGRRLSRLFVALSTPPKWKTAGNRGYLSSLLSSSPGITGTNAPFSDGFSLEK